MSQFITTTTLSQMRSLGSSAERSLQRLQVVLAREFPDGAGFELAEPVPRKDGAGIDWYTDTDETLTRLSDLPPDIAAAYRARLYQAVQIVMAAAAARGAGGDAAGKATATALRNAVTFPDEDNVWIAGDTGTGDGTIVLAAWGYERHDGPAAGRSEIVGPARDRLPPGMSVQDDTAAPAKPEAPPMAEAVARRPWWASALGPMLALTALLLAVLIAWLLLPACGIRLPFGVTAFGTGGGAYCAPVAEARPADPAGARTQDLIAEADVLEEQLRRRLNSCVAPAPEPPPVVPEPPQTDAADRVEEAGGQRGQTEVTLIWNNREDLDLMVKCPGGGMIARGGANCGAKHDVDMNFDNNFSDRPVEHVTWEQKPPPGRYQVFVKLHPSGGGEAGGPAPETEFQVEVKIGDRTTPYTRQLSRYSRNPEQLLVAEFDIQ